MLLASHILVGAAVAASTPNILLGLVFAFLSHFLLDRIPHWEYSIDPLKQIKTKGAKYCMPIFRRVALDTTLGLIMLIVAVGFSRSDVSLAVYIFGGVFGALADGLSFLLFLAPKNAILSKFLKYFYALHQKFHFDTKKSPPLRIGIATQAIAILLALYFIIF
ncbi:MAG: hypothetical protein WAP23_00480 [Candidatus Spechtbacterales bacterium]